MKKPHEISQNVRKMKFFYYIFLAGIFILLSVPPRTYGADAPKGYPDKIGQDSSAKEASTTVRAGKYANYFRIVFETNESNVKNASVIVTGDNTVKVDFQSPVSFRLPLKGSQKSFFKMEGRSARSRAPVEIIEGLRITVDANGCVLTVDNLDDIEVSKLPSPARLVIDAYIRKPSGEAPEKSGKPSGAEAPLAPADISAINFEVFVIDAGHGGYDSGIRYGKKTEKDITLAFAKDIAAVLNKNGKKVFLTRKGDHALSLKDRIRTANKKSPEIFISIHTSSGSGFCIYSAKNDAARKAEAGKKSGEESGQTVTSPPHATAAGVADIIANGISKNISNEFNLEAEHKKLNIGMLKSVNAEAVLIELPAPEKFNYSAKNKERIINAILKGMTAPSKNQAEGQGKHGSIEG